MMWIFTKPKFDRIIIIGLGLIGGSIAAACRAAKIDVKISAYDVDKKQLDFALENQIIDEIYGFEKISGNSLVIIAVPLSSYADIAVRIASEIDDKVTITDIGSLKNFVVERILPIFGDKKNNFVPTHPIAGSEKSGVNNARANLFLDKKIILTPTQFTNKKALKKVELFWQKIGGKTEIMEAKNHDKIFALVSHLPQFLAFIQPEKSVVSDNILLQHLRLQSSNPLIWRDIFNSNKANLDYYLKYYLENLKIFENNDLAIISFLKKADAVLNLAEEKFEKKDAELILKRVFLVAAFINLPDINQFKIHGGSGFRDFTAILSYVKYVLKYPEIIQENHQSLLQFLSEIKCYKN